MDAQNLYLFDNVPNANKYVQTVYNRLCLDTTGEDFDFYDRYARCVKCPQFKDGKNRDLGLILPVECCRILWDLKLGAFCVSEDGQELWMREVDGMYGRKLESWKRCEDVCSVYDVPKQQSNTAWQHQIVRECLKQPKRMVRGVKFKYHAFMFDRGRVRLLNVEDSRFNNPFELTIDADLDELDTDTARELLAECCADSASAANLRRMFACPFLEEYKHFSFILSGNGGNGKGIIINALSNAFQNTCRSVDASRLLGGKQGNTASFSAEQEAARTRGAFWIYDEDADEIGLRQMSVLKKISTGDTLTSREIGRNAVAFKNRATLIIATNDDVVTSLNAASDRRIVRVRMRDGRKAEEFEPLIRFTRRNEGAYAFIALSCFEWLRNGQEALQVSASNAALSEAEEWIADQINENGYAFNRLNPFKPKNQETRTACAKMGLKSVVRRIDGQPCRVLVVCDEHRFAPYREQEQTVEAENTDTVALPEPIENADPADLKQMFECAFVPCGRDKVARNWKQNAENGGIPEIPENGTPYGVVPDAGFCVIDCDTQKNGGECDGFTALNMQVGEYGSEALPETWAVKTPSGGLHLYYKIPQALRGKLKNCVRVGGVPADIRCEGKGYVVGAGSVTDKGEYRLCGLPDSDSVPELSPQLCDWLKIGGAVETVKPRTSQNLRDLSEPRPSFSGGERGGTPDLSPVPEGQRNNTLFLWTLGRLIHYPQNAPQIREDLRTRGRISGLSDRECDTIWNSANKHALNV